MSISYICGMSKSQNKIQEAARDLSTIFSRKTILDLMKDDFTEVDLKIKRYRDGLSKSNTNSYLSFYRYAYNILENGYRNEYFYKNTLVNELFYNELRQNKSVLYNEFRVSDSVCDLVVFNGCSKGYEIKTEYDSPSRLKTQLTDYKKILNEVYLVVPSEKLERYEQLDSEVGLITFSKKSSSKLKIYRESNSFHISDKLTLLNTLRTNEYKDIVFEYFGYLPEMNSFNQYEICKDLIFKIPVSDLNRLYVRTLKKRKRHINYDLNYFKEFNQLCLNLGFDKQQKKEFLNKLKVLTN